MEIEQLNRIHGYDMSHRDLLSYLSQIVLSKTDEEIEIREGEIKIKRQELTESKERLKNIKERLIRISVESKRLGALYRVLKLIDTLKQEGVIIGNNRAKITKLLHDIHEQNFQKLRALEERLSMYLPDHSRVSVS